MVIAGGGEGEYRSINDDKGDLTWGGQNAIRCTDDVLWDCVSEPRPIYVFNQCYPNKVNEKMFTSEF